ncbi:hypothetical protein [Deinococcus maricopensis]|uniref:Septum formation initiator n=1 Tax=Deinococcus maricopensis (strain DSM 21211 / LMG 22137 / NRRL B-23946 / LB-34) TaxID=709986 RepID=E8U3J2_DEIML|nr:hypothetical protein [Deinococcus maricopensis]ADV68616.1 hypothetical protein Deima_2987 [Deinococcus maricopensis DSM 21211]
MRSFRFPSWQQWRRLPLAMVIASVLAGLGIVQMTFLIGHTAYRSVTWSREARQARADVKVLREDIRVLTEVQTHANDPVYLGALARCLGFVGAEERVVVDENAVEPKSGNCEPVRLP